MDVATKSITAKSEYSGQICYFCSVGCKESFDKEPEFFLTEENDYMAQSKDQE